MATKKITDLLTRSGVTADLYFPSDDGIETYKVSAAQILAYIAANSGPGPWTAYTPTFGAGYGTVTNDSFFWRLFTDIDGELEVEIKGVWEVGTVDSNPGTISLPLTYAVDPSRIPLFGNRSIVGEMHNTSSAGSNGIFAVQSGNVVIVDSSDYDVLFIANFETTDASSTITNKCVGNTALNNGSNCWMRALVPVV